MTKFAYYMGLHDSSMQKAHETKDINLKMFFQSAAKGWKERALNLRLSECQEIIF